MEEDKIIVIGWCFNDEARPLANIFLWMNDQLIKASNIVIDSRVDVIKLQPEARAPAGFIAQFPRAELLSPYSEACPPKIYLSAEQDCLGYGINLDLSRFKDIFECLLGSHGNPPVA